MTKTEFVEWKTHPTTVEIFKFLTIARDDLKDFLGNGGTLAKTSEVTTEMVVGRIQGLNDILMMEYQETPEEKREKYVY